MRIIVAPDSYKGSVSATRVAKAMERGIMHVFPDCYVHKAPIADGGEGTVEALVMSTGGEIIEQEVTGPLGNRIKSFWGILGDGETAVIEMAAASGLPLVPKELRNPCITTTFGTGELIKAALNRGLRKIIIGIGGSATNDGGCGMAQALGIRFLDEYDQELAFGGAHLVKLANIDISTLDLRVLEAELLVACDVDNPLCGPRGASAVYGPQKGASPEIVNELDKALEHYGNIAKECIGKDIAKVPGAGAAGGLGAGFLFFTNAKLKPGIEIVLETIKLEALVKEATFVITGEGNTDFQTAYGKAPVGVAKLAQKHNVQTMCISGGLGKGHEKVLEQGIDGIASITERPMSLEECMERGEELIEGATKRLCQILKVGMKIR